MSNDTGDLDYFSMSDEEISGMVSPPGSTPNDLEDLTNEENSVSDNSEALPGSSGNEQSNNAEGEYSEESSRDENEQSLDESELDPDAEILDSSDGEPNVFEEGDSPDEEDDEGEPEGEADGDPEVSAAQNTEYENFYKAITAPFKANGTELTVKSAEEAISLMQKGANYHKKMSGLKPNLALLRMLENNGLLDEAKLSHLIDLDKKDPKAIAKLIKDGEIDPIDIDQEDASDYTPNTYTVDEAQLQLDEVIDDIRHTDSFSQTLDIVNTKWDKKSQQALLANPNDIKVINEHISTGAFAHITKIVEGERMKGELTNLSDLEAYVQVGNALQAQVQKTAQANKSKAATENAIKQKNAALNAKRQRASSPTGKKTSNSKSEPNYDPLNMSDEEFAKFAEKL